VRAKYQQAATSLLAALEDVNQRGDQADWVLKQRLDAQHDRYLNAIARMFAAADAGNTRRVLAIDENQADPLFGSIEERVNAAADAHHQAALAGLSALRRQERPW
jgi:hypothetical protein